VAFGAVSLGIIALEQATLLALLRAPLEQPVGLAAAVAWALGRSRAVVGLAARFVAIMALIAAPFLGVAALIATSLLGEFDINYYLAEQPPAFRLAVACGVGLLGGYVAVVAWLLSGWLLALPMVLFEQLPANEAFAESRRRVAGNRRLVLGLVLCWGAGSLLAGSLCTSAVVMAARQLVPLSTGTLPGLVLAIGLTLLAWFAVGLLVNLLATTTFAALLAESYRRLSRLEPTATPPATITTERVPRAVRLTRGWRLKTVSTGTL